MTLGIGHRGSFAGSAQSHDIVYTVGNNIINEGFQLAEIDGGGFSKRGHKGDAGSNKRVFHTIQSKTLIL